MLQDVALLPLTIYMVNIAHCECGFICHHLSVGQPSSFLIQFSLFFHQLFFSHPNYLPSFPLAYFFYSPPVSTLSSYRQICPFRSLPLFLPAPNLPLTLRPCFPYSRPFLYAVRSFLFASRWNTQLLCISVIISPKCRISQWSYELLSTF